MSDFTYIRDIDDKECAFCNGAHHRVRYYRNIPDNYFILICKNCYGGLSSQEIRDKLDAFYFMAKL